MTGTTMICAYCGRPIIGTPMTFGGAGEPYHLQCTLPPMPANSSSAGTSLAIPSRPGDGGANKARETIQGAYDYLTDNIEPPNGMGKEQAAVLVLAGWLENATAE